MIVSGERCGSAGLWGTGGEYLLRVSGMNQYLTGGLWWSMLAIQWLLMLSSGEVTFDVRTSTDMLIGETFAMEYHAHCLFGCFSKLATPAMIQYWPIYSNKPSVILESPMFDKPPFGSPRTVSLTLMIATRRWWFCATRSSQSPVGAS